MPTFGSLFAGIGGIDLGLERAGWTGRWQVEWDEYCQHVLAHHWPDIPRYGDITTVDWSTVEPVDLIAGGFPCQPVSLAGLQRGQDDQRWLWPEFARAIRCLRPRLVLVENVPGLLVRGMGDVQRDLAQLGYRRGWGVLSAADVGAPHLRRRVWIVAHADSDEYQGGAYAKWWATVQDLFADPLGPDLWEQSVAFEWGSGASEPRDDGATWSLADAEGDRWESWWPGDATQGAQRREPHRGGIREPLADANREGPQGRSVQPERTDQWPVGAGSLADPASIGGGALGAHLDGPRGPDRAIRGGGQWLTEPDVGRVAHGVPARVDRLRALGNAVVPQVVEVIGQRLLASLEEAA